MNVWAKLFPEICVLARVHHMSSFSLHVSPNCPLQSASNFINLPLAVRCRKEIPTDLQIMLHFSTMLIRKKESLLELVGQAIAEHVDGFDARVGSLQVGQNSLHENVSTMFRVV